MRDRRVKENALASKALPKVLVATQVVEVSLDISFDVGFFEAAPIDALAQRMGRVNRRGDNDISPAPIVIASRAISKHRLYDSERTATTLDLLKERTEPLSERDLVEVCDCVYGEGYTGSEKITFEERLNHKLLANFREELVAGQHRNWIEAVIEQSDGRADVLPISLQDEYQRLMDEGCWLDADSLLVNAYASGISEFLDRRDEPWIAHVPYGKDGLETPESRK